ncbi:MAG: biopolymer transport protein ExbD [Puniceicoccaceae bacterium 5H]|nr:MAG: biopolymer transport protein ExbD [Puniceicoccaceae bacterium 5H]
MARSFTRKERLSAMSELNVTPLIDLAFSLLIIFMITAPLLEQSIDINLPKDKPRQSSGSQVEVEVIGIDASGQIYWGDEPMTPAQLDDTLSLIAMEEDPPVIQIRADESLAYQKVIEVLGQVKGQGLNKISLQTVAQ